MTSKQRLDRIHRLVTLKERNRNQKRNELAEAQRSTEQARSAHEQAETTWQECAEDASADSAPVSIAEFAESRVHLDSLKREADVAELKRLDAEREECARRNEARNAQRELRKMEIWGENEAAKVRAHKAREEQNETNELAARIASQGRS